MGSIEANEIPIRTSIKSCEMSHVQFPFRKVSPLSHISISVKYFTETEILSFPLVSAGVKLYDSIIM